MNRSGFVGAALIAAFAALISLPRLGLAQSGYHVGEHSDQPAVSDGYNSQQGPADDDTRAPEESGPVRMARFSYVNGNVTYRGSESDDWQRASNNIPLREGGQVWVGDGGRAELQFDDGSALRLGSGGVVTLQTLFSDTRGEYTEIKMNDGLASLDLITPSSIFQVDTPRGSIRAAGPCMARIGVDDEVEVGVKDGSASFEGPQGKIDLKGGDYLDVANDQAPYALKDLPLGDAWDQFVDERHGAMSQHDSNLPQNLQRVSGDLDNYGSWHQDPDYGNVWAPNEPSDWAPYTTGSWTWTEPWGWTWVGAEPWGWAPYHYGTWVRRHWGWCWVPGPAYQYWSPGVVTFSSYGGDYCWTPLAPWEVVYPTAYPLGGFGVGWDNYFSIGFCGLFVFDGGICRPHRWDSYWVNSWRYHFYGDRRRFDWRTEANAGFHPANAHEGAVGFAAARDFGLTRSSRMPLGQVDAAFRDGHPAVTPGVRPLGRFGSSYRNDSLGRSDEGAIFRRPTYSDRQNGYGGVRNGADAANRARQSLGGTGYYGTNGYRGNLSQGRAGFGGFGGGQTYGNRQSSGSHSWSVPDHSGWTHQHTSSGGGGGGDNGHGNGHGNGH